MIAKEIQMRYVIRDKIQCETKNSVQDKFLTKFFSGKKKKKKIVFLTNFFFQQKFFSHKIFFVRKKILWEKKFSLENKFCCKKNSRILSQTEFCLGFPVCFFYVVSEKSMLIITTRYTYRNETCYGKETLSK